MVKSVVNLVCVLCEEERGCTGTCVRGGEHE